MIEHRHGNDDETKTEGALKPSRSLRHHARRLALSGLTLVALLGPLAVSAPSASADPRSVRGGDLSETELNEALQRFVTDGDAALSPSAVDTEARADDRSDRAEVEVDDQGVVESTEPKEPEDAPPFSPDGLDLAGGPDNTGYLFVDSDEVDGPAAGTFTDISKTGTSLGMGDDSFAQRRLSGEPLVSPDPDVLDFLFTYYDIPYDQVFVGSNGFLSFVSGSTTTFNQCPLPNGGAPNNLIAGLWDDWNPSATAADVYVQTFGFFPNRTFIAQWEDVSHFSERATTVTFQVQLFERSGNILMAFKDVESGGPDGIAFDSVTGELYVASAPGDKVQRHSTAGTFLGNAVKHNVGGLDMPAGIAFGEDLNLDGADDLYVSSFETDEIIVYDQASGSLLGNLVPPNSGGLDGPRGIYYDGTDIFVASFETDEVFRYSATTGGLVSTFITAGLGGLDGPDSIVLGPDGNLYVSSFNSDQILRYDTSGGFVDVFVAANSGGLDGPRGLAFGPDGNLYVSSQNSDQVLRYFGNDGSIAGVIADSANDGIDAPRGLIFGTDLGGAADDDLYVANFGSNEVLAFSLELTQFTSGTPPNQPHLIRFGPDNHLYVASFGSDDVRRYNGATGAFIDIFADDDPGTLFVDEAPSQAFSPLFRAADLFVSAFSDSDVKRYDAAGNPVGGGGIFASGGGLNGPTGMLFNPSLAGDLLVSSGSSNEVKRYDAGSGAFVSTFVAAGSGGLTNPRDLILGPTGSRVFVSSFDTNEVLSYDASTGGGALTLVSSPGAPNALSGPEGLLLYPSNATLAVASRSTDDVYAFNATTGNYGGRFFPTGSAGLNGPIGITQGPDGRLYVAGVSNNAVYVFDATLQATFDTGGDFAAGRSSTVGIENAGGTDGLTYGCGTGGTTVASPTVVKEDLAILWKAPPPPGQDIEVVYKTVDDNMPNEGDTIQYEIKVINNGRDDATGVTVEDQLPTGVTYAGTNNPSQGAYNPGTGIWTVGALTVGQMETLTIDVTVDPDTASTLGRFLEEYVVADAAEPPPPSTPTGRVEKPTGLVIRGGSQFVASFGTSEVLEYDLAGNFIGKFVTDDPTTDLVDENGPLSNPVGMAFSPTDGHLYISSYGTDQVLRFDGTTGDFLGVAVENLALNIFPQGLFGPQGIVFDPNNANHLLVTSSRNNQVRRYRNVDTTGVFVEVVAANLADLFDPFPGSNLGDPYDLVFGPDLDGDTLEDLYVTSRNTSEVLVYDVELGGPVFIDDFVTAGDGGLAGPTGLTFGPNGGLYVASMGSAEVYRYDDVTGDFEHIFVPSLRGGLVLPQFIAFTPSGTLKVASQGSHQVLEYGARASGDFKEIIDSGSAVSNVRAIFADGQGQLDVAVRKDGDNDNLVVRRYNIETGELVSDDFIDEDLVSFISGPLCNGVAGGSISIVDDLVISDNGEDLFVSVRMSCTAASNQSAVLHFRGPQDATMPGEFLGLRLFSSGSIFGGPNFYPSMTIGPDGNVYVAVNSGGLDRVLRLDSDTGANLGTFASGGGLNSPHGVAFGTDLNGDGTPELFVADIAANNVKAYNGLSGGFISNFASAGMSAPADLTFGPDNLLYVSNFGNSQIRRYDGTNGASLGILTTTNINGPVGLLFAPNGDLYVANASGNSITRYDGSAAFLGICGTVSDDGLNCGTFMTFGPDQNGDGFEDLYVSSDFSDDVKVYQGPEGAAPGAFIEIFVDAADGLDGPRDIVFGPDGNFYVASQNNDSVFRFTPAGVAFPSPVSGANFGGAHYLPPGLFDLDGPVGLAFNPDTQDLLVGAYQGNKILQFLGPGSGFYEGLPFGFPFNIQPFVDFGGTPSLVAPQDIEFGPDGNLFVSTPAGVHRYDGEFGTFIDIFAIGNGLANPKGLEFGPDENLYVVSQGASDVLIFEGPTSGNPGAFVSGFVQEDPPDDGNPLVDPIDATFGPNGDLYVSSCTENQVLRYSGFIVNMAEGSVPLPQMDPRLYNNKKSVGIVVKGADLAVEKTVSNATPIENEQITYTVNITNEGPEPALNVTATDVLNTLVGPLPAPFTYVSDTPSEGAFNIGTGIWSGISLNVGETATLQVVVSVNVGAPQLNPVVTNTVTVEDGVQGDPDDRNNMASVEVFLIYADLEITKTVDNMSPEENGVIEYTITVTNLEEDPTDGIIVVDRLPGGLQYNSFTANPPAGTYDRITGLWLVNGTLDKGDSATLTIQATVLPGTGGETIVNEARIGDATLNDPDLTNNMAEKDITVLGADLSIDKSIDIGVTPPPYIEGGQVNFVLTATNAGPQEALNAVVSDRLPVGLGFVSATTVSGSYDAGSGLWTLPTPMPNGAVYVLTIVAELQPGFGGIDLVNAASISSDTGDQDRSNNSDSVTITPPNVDLVVRKDPRPDPATAGEPLFYDVTVTNEGRTPAPNTVLVDVLPADVAYVADDLLPPCVEAPVGTLTCQLGSIPGGESKTFTIQTEVHPNAYVNRLALGDELELTNNLSVTHDDFELNPENNVYNELTILVDRADLKLTTLTQATAPPAELAELDLDELLALDLESLSGMAPEAEVSNGAEDSESTSDNGVDLDASAGGSGGVSAGLLSQIRAGEIFTYTILVENLGPSTARRVALTDTILSSGTFVLNQIIEDPDRLDTCGVVAATPPHSGQFIECTLDENLEPVGAGLGTGRWEIQVEVTATETQDIEHEVRVYTRDDPANRLPGTPDPNLANNVGGDEISVLDTSNLSLTKTAVGRVHDPNNCAVVTDTPDAVTAGDRLTYTLIVTNNAPLPGAPGGSTAPNVVVRDFLPAWLEVQSISGTGPDGPAGCTPGTPGLGADPATCNVGTLIAGNSATITIEVLVDPDYVLLSESNLIQNGAFAFSENIDPDYRDNLVQNTAGVTEVSDLQVTKDSSPDPVIAGESLSYEIRVINRGFSTAREVVVRDQLPGDVEFRGASIDNQVDGESCTYVTGAHEVVCSLHAVSRGLPNIGRLITINTQVKASRLPGSGDPLVTPPGHLINTVTASSDQTPDCNPANNTDITETTDVETQADLEIIKHSEPDKVFAGEQKRYEIWVNNLGPSDDQNVQVYDVLPDEVEYEIDTNGPMCTQPANLLGFRAVLSGDNEVPPAATNASGLATFVLDTDTNTLHYSVFLNDINNLVGAAGIHIHRGAAGVNGPVEVFLYDGSAPAPSPTEPLVGEVAIAPALAAEIVANPADFYINVHTTDFTGGEIRDQLVATRNSPLSCPLGLLPAGESRHFDIWALVRPETLSGTTITNVAIVEGETSLGDPRLWNNTDFSKNLVLGKSDLKITKFGKNDGQVRAGEVLTYTVIVDNYGPSFAEGVAVKDILQTSGVFDLIDIASDRPALCRTLPARGDQPAAGIDLPAQPWPVTDPPPAFGVLDPIGQENINQRLEIDCELTEVLDPDPLETRSQLAVLAADGPPNSGRWILTVRVRAEQAQDMNNIADVVSNGEDENLENNHAEVEHEITDVADLSVVKSMVGEVQVDGQAGQIFDINNGALAFPAAPNYATSPTNVTAGRRIRYTLDIKNDGPSDAENVEIIDRLPPGVTLIPGTVNISIGGVAQPANLCRTGTPGETLDRMVCGLGMLRGINNAAESVAQITFDVLVDPDVSPGAVLENDVRVASDVFDPNNQNNRSFTQTIVNTWADMSASKTATGENVTGYDAALMQFIVEDQPDNVTAGLLLRYEIAVQNNGPSTSRRVTVRERLPAGVTVERVDGANCRPDDVNQGEFYCVLGDVAIGERKTFDLYVRVAPEVPQGTVLTNCIDVLELGATPPGQPPALPGSPPELALTDDPLDTNDENQCNATTVNAVADVGGPDGPDSDGGNTFISKRDVPAEPRLDMLYEPDLALAGKQHRYRITFGNAGPSTALDVVVQDQLDFKQPAIPGETFVRCEPLDPDDLVTCVYDAATHTVTLQSLQVQNEAVFTAGSGTLQPGIGYGFDLVVMVDKGYVLDASNAMPTADNSEPGVIARNTVSISTSTTDFHTANDRDTERTLIIAEADLQIEKTDIFGDPLVNPGNAFLQCDPVIPGGMITWDLTITNHGPSDAAEVFVVDYLPSEFVAVDPAQVMVEVSAGEVVEIRDDGRLTIRLGNDVNNEGNPELGRLNCDSVETIRIQAMVRQSAECGGSALNLARVETRRNDAMWPQAVQGPAAGNPKGAPLGPRTPTYDPDNSNNRATETTRIECPSVMIDKTVSFDGTCPGKDLPVINDVAQPVTFCFKITNTGTTYLDNIMITDTLKTHRGMPTIIFTDTIRHGADPKVPVAPGEMVLRQVTIDHLTRDCGNVDDMIEISANPVNSGRTDLPCLPTVSGMDTLRIEVPCNGVDFRLQLPILDTELCETWVQVQNVGDQETIALLVVWGESGFCPPQAAGPLKAECSGLLRPGSAWGFTSSQIPVGANSGVVYSISTEEVEVEANQPVPFGLLLCDAVFHDLVGDHFEWIVFDAAYRQRGMYHDFDFGEYRGEPLAVSVNRRCPDAVSPGVASNAAYTGISSDMEGAYDPRYGAYTYYAPMVFADRAGLNTMLHIQNSGDLCSSLEIWMKAQDNCIRPIIGDILTLAPGESITFDPNTVVGPDWLGSLWIRATQRMGIIVDTVGANHFSSYAAVPGDVGALNFSQGDQINFGPLAYSEYQGWDTIVQVQNLSAVTQAKVKVYFLDRSGDIKTTLVDWICPRGSQTFFSPVIAGLPGNWVGSVRIESQEWWDPGLLPQDPPRIQSVILLERWSDPARTTRREAMAYNAHTETIYDWQIGSRKGGVTDGSAVLAVPLLAKGNRGITSEIAITNLVPKPGFTDFAIFIYDQNGLLDFVCQKLHDRQVEYIDLNTWGLIPQNFLGSMVISATFWEHDVFDGEGNFVRNLVGLSSVAVERVGSTQQNGDIPGDESKAFGAFPLFDFFMNEARPDCPGVP